MQDEVAHAADRGGRSDGHDERRRGNHDEAPAAATAVGAESTKHVVPVGLTGGSRENSIESRAVEISHVRTSSSWLRSATRAALRVAATVPELIPSASLIAA